MQEAGRRDGLDSPRHIKARQVKSPDQVTSAGISVGDLAAVRGRKVAAQETRHDQRNVDAPFAPEDHTTGGVIDGMRALDELVGKRPGQLLEETQRLRARGRVSFWHGKSHMLMVQSFLSI